MDFWRAAEIINKRKWLIILCVLVSVAFTYGVTRLIGAEWVATVTFVVPDNQILSAASGQDSSSGSPDDRSMMLGAILRSSEVIKPVLQHLHETAVPKGMTTLFASDGNHLYDLQVTDTSKPVAEAWANAYADQLVVVYHDLETHEAQKSVTFLQAELEKTDAELTEDRNKYQQLAISHNVSGDVQLNIQEAYERLQDTTQQRDQELATLASDQARLQAVASQLSQVKPATLESLEYQSGPVGAEYTAVEQTKQDLAQLLTHETELHPDVIAEKQKLNDLQNKLSQDAAALAMSPDHNPAIAGLRAEMTAAEQEVAGSQAQVATLDAAVQKSQAQVVGLNGASTPLATLNSDITLQEGVRDAIFARLDAAESAVDGAARQFPLAVLNPAGPLNQALNKTAGRTEKLLILAALGSFIAICTLLIGLDSIDRRLRTVGQAQLQLPTRLLAAIPQQAPGKGYIEIARMTELQPRSLASESYRFLGLHLLSQHNPEIRSLMVLAAKAEQGSTTTITNLGITLAQAGKRVIIVDANIRTTELHKVFELPNLHGYTDLLRDPTEETLAQAMQATSTPGLMVITCGIVPDNPWQLFRSENIRHASALMHRHADFVLYDTPSSLIFTDALNLAPVVDSAILCVRAQEALTGTEERLIQLLEEANVRVIGSVLHDVPVNQMEGYQNYQLYYRPIEGPTNVGMIEPPKSALPGPAGVGSGRNGSDNGHG